MLKQRLKLARLACGLSLRDLQSRIGNRVTAQSIGKYERGESIPSPDVLQVLCDALNTLPEQLLSEKELVLESVDFRKSLTASKKDETSVQSQILKHLEYYFAIEDALGMSTRNWEKPRGAPYAVNDIRDAEDAAYVVRHDWGLGMDPIPHLTSLLEDRGIKVVSVDLDSVDGLAAKVRTSQNFQTYVIAANKKNWSERKRFTLCHELAHLTLGVSSDVNSERAADRFAGAFLMPAETLRAAMGSHRTSISLGELWQLKKIFGASFQAITYRCRELGIINQTLFGKLFDEFTARGWRTYPFKELGAIPADFEMPERLRMLCWRGLSEQLLDEDLVSEALSEDVEQIKAYMSEPYSDPVLDEMTES